LLIKAPALRHFLWNAATALFVLEFLDLSAKDIIVGKSSVYFNLINATGMVSAQK
jgi:hypothetical protein